MLGSDWNDCEKWSGSVTCLHPCRSWGTFNLHMSNQGGAIPHSHRSTLNTLMFGKKRWIMINPLDYPSDLARVAVEQFLRASTQRSPSINAPTYTSQEWFADEARALLRSFEVPYYDFVQSAGDAVWIPEFWMHATMDLCRWTVATELMGPFVTRGHKYPGTQRFLENGFQDFTWFEQIRQILRDKKKVQQLSNIVLRMLNF